MQTAKNIMTRDIQVIRPDADLTEVAEKMRRNNIGILPVVDGSRIRGMISDRDIVIRALAEHRDPRKTRASDIMSGEVVFCNEDDSVDKVASFMRENHLRRLVIVDRNNSVTGILSVEDLATKAKDELTPDMIHALVSQRRETWRPEVLTQGVRNWGFLALASSLVVVGYFLLNRRTEIRERISNVLPNRLRERGEAA